MRLGKRAQATFLISLVPGGSKEATLSLENGEEEKIPLASGLQSNIATQTKG
jgi:hypothetical protein